MMPAIYGDFVFPANLTHPSLFNTGLSERPSLLYVLDRFNDIGLFQSFELLVYFGLPCVKDCSGLEKRALTLGYISPASNTMHLYPTHFVTYTTKLARDGIGGQRGGWHHSLAG